MVYDGPAPNWKPKQLTKFLSHPKLKELMEDHTRYTDGTERDAEDDERSGGDGDDVGEGNDPDDPDDPGVADDDGPDQDR